MQIDKGCGKFPIVRLRKYRWRKGGAVRGKRRHKRRKNHGREQKWQSICTIKEENQSIFRLKYRHKNKFVLDSVDKSFIGNLIIHTKQRPQKKIGPTSRKCEKAVKNVGIRQNTTKRQFSGEIQSRRTGSHSPKRPGKTGPVCGNPEQKRRGSREKWKTAPVRRRRAGKRVDIGAELA